jgi:hypothetical protein
MSLIELQNKILESSVSQKREGQIITEMIEWAKDTINADADELMSLWTEAYNTKCEHKKVCIKGTSKYIIKQCDKRATKYVFDDTKKKRCCSYHSKNYSKTNKEKEECLYN